MKTKNKAMITVLSVGLLVAALAFGTLAYFTDHDAVTNTFTVGNVDIILDEADVNEDGTYVEDEDQRVKENAYHLIPGHTYIKDPTVTVLKNSEESYVRMKVTFNYSKELDAIFEPGADLTKIFEGYDVTVWPLVDVTEDEANNIRTYEFRYNGTVAKANVDTELEPLFTAIKVPGELTKEQLATLVTKNAAGEITDQFKITVVAHAIQAAGFADENNAWNNFTK